MFEVGVSTTFQASHRLHGDFGPAAQAHSHDYRVEARVSGGALQADGTLLDITLMQTALAEQVDALSGRSLNNIAELDTRNPTAEVLAQYLWQKVAARLRAGAASHLRVTVWESDEAFASFADDLP